MPLMASCIMQKGQESSYGCGVGGVLWVRTPCVVGGGDVVVDAVVTQHGFEPGGMLAIRFSTCHIVAHTANTGCVL